ncbi:hypothetical protein ASPFODRAFT_694074 [Aspergillus luchuensis CBS 106.47]|uniref:Uncharacterized protein n=1 Tax=Aspergillus luchuensis (strain CBS 106.47) TaxID=1137211 RepID=A0A1M3TDI1_ASPLC|nr:hypothetical protein ASPFODRAFT_694074 [Aspergillus luchuensis CBS 106.47]
MMSSVATAVSLFSFVSVELSPRRTRGFIQAHPVPHARVNSSPGRSLARSLICLVRRCNKRPQDWPLCPCRMSCLHMNVASRSRMAAILPK